MALANKYFPHTNPIGRVIKLSRSADPSQPWLTIIGVVADVRTTTVFQEMGYVGQPTVYRPFAQSASSSLALMVVANGRPLGLVGGIEDKLASLDRDLVLGGVATMNDKQSAILSQPRNPIPVAPLMLQVHHTPVAREIVYLCGCVRLGNFKRGGSGPTSSRKTAGLKPSRTGSPESRRA